MSENLMVGTHKHSTPEFRDGWDRTFGNDQSLNLSEESLEKAIKDIGKMAADKGKTLSVKPTSFIYINNE